MQAPTRAEFERSERELLERGSRKKADLYALDTSGGSFVVKDFARKGPWRRVLGRLQIAREERIYRLLEGVPGVAGLVGRIDAHALVLERVEGRPLGVTPTRFTRADDYVEQLRVCVERMHARGVLHMDLRGRENVVVRSDHRVVVLDFASSLHLRPGSIAHRILFRTLSIPDESGWLKWKLNLTPEHLTDDEKRRIRRFNRIRGLWPFNRKVRSGVLEPPD